MIAHGFVDSRDNSICVLVHGQLLPYPTPYVAALVLHTNGYRYLEAPPTVEGWPDYATDDASMLMTVNEEMRLLREAVRERPAGLIKPEHPAETERITA